MSINALGYITPLVDNAITTGSSSIVYTTAHKTATVADLRSGYIKLSGTPGGPFNFVLPTAAQIVAAIPGCAIGTKFACVISNGTGQTITVTAATGDTLKGTAAIADGNVDLLTVIVTNVTSTTEAVLAVNNLLT